MICWNSANETVAARSVAICIMPISPIDAPGPSAPPPFLEAARPFCSQTLERRRAHWSREMVMLAARSTSGSVRTERAIARGHVLVDCVFRSTSIAEVKTARSHGSIDGRVTRHSSASE